MTDDEKSGDELFADFMEAIDFDFNNMSERELIIADINFQGGKRIGYDLGKHAIEQHSKAFSKDLVDRSWDDGHAVGVDESRKRDLRADIVIVVIAMIVGALIGVAVMWWNTNL